MFAAVLLLAGTAAAAWLLLGLPVPPCLWKEATGLPCPTCGATRMARALLRGRLLQALAWNPLLFLGTSAVLGGGGVCALRRAMGRPRLRIVLEGPRERLAVRIAAIAMILLGWGYLVLRGV